MGAALTEFAVRLMQKLGDPQHVAMVRMVIGAAEQFPELARSFYEAGPAYGHRRLSAYLEAQTRHGRLAIPDPNTAAWQFLGMCVHPTLIGVVLAAQKPPDADLVRGRAESAVATFLARYAPAD